MAIQSYSFDLYSIAMYKGSIPWPYIKTFNNTIFDMCCCSDVKLRLVMTFIYITWSSVSITEGEFFPFFTMLSPVQTSALNLNAFPHIGLSFFF